MSDNLVMNMPNVREYNNELKVAGDGLHMGVNDDLNTTMKGQTLVMSLVKTSPIKRMPITSVTNKIKVSEKSSKTSKTDDTSTSMTKTRLTNKTNETIDKHGVIYDTNTNSSSEHEDMKTLLIPSGILAGQGYMS